MPTYQGIIVPQCPHKHHALMHEGASPSVTVSATSSSSDCYLGIVPVTIEGRGKVIHTYALLDNGSQKTLCTESLTERLGLSGRQATFSVNSVNDKTVDYQGQQLDLTARPASGGPAIQLKEAWTVNQLPVVISHMATAEESRTWPHLRGVKAPRRANGVVELLIGTDVPTAHVPIEIRSGNASEPYAVKTALGWAVRGPRKVSPSPGNGVLRGTVIGCTSVCIQTSDDRRRTCDADLSERPVAATITSKEDNMPYRRWSRLSLYRRDTTNSRVHGAMRRQLHRRTVHKPNSASKCSIGP